MMTDIERQVIAGLRMALQDAAMALRAAGQGGPLSSARLAAEMADVAVAASLRLVPYSGMVAMPLLPSHDKEPFQYRVCSTEPGAGAHSIGDDLPELIAEANMLCRRHCTDFLVLDPEGRTVYTTEMGAGE